jgi:hypothetical protein
MSDNPGLLAPIKQLDPRLIARAIKRTAGHARNADDLRELLDALGITCDM